MTCDAMWMVASFHSTSLPFIQILPVPGNPIESLLTAILTYLVIGEFGNRVIGGHCLGGCFTLSLARGFVGLFRTTLRKLPLARATRSAVSARSGAARI